MRVIRQCEVEAIYNRCIPFGTGLGLAAYFGVQRGILKVITLYDFIRCYFYQKQKISLS